MVYYCDTAYKLLMSWGQGMSYPPFRAIVAGYFCMCAKHCIVQGDWYAHIRASVRNTHTPTVCTLGSYYVLCTTVYCVLCTVYCLLCTAYYFGTINLRPLPLAHLNALTLFAMFYVCEMCFFLVFLCFIFFNIDILNDFPC
jgi:hypothetical protein